MAGKQTTTNSIPAWLEDAGQGVVDRSQQVADIGYVPYFGPDVAAFTPQQQASFAATNDAASAFGLPTGSYSGPQAQDFGGGLMAHSSAPTFLNSLSALMQANPGQFDAVAGKQAGAIRGLLGSQPQGGGNDIWAALMRNYGGQ